MSILNLAEENIYYEVIGSGEPLVCIGGFTADHAVWGSIVPILKDYYQIILLDNPGCGQSSVPNKNFMMEDFADVVIKLCDHLNIEQAYFLGNSMGGAIVQQLAYSYPERVKKAVISNSFMNAKQMPFALFAKARETWFESNLPEQAVVQAMLAWCFSGNFLTAENIELLMQLNLSNAYSQTKEGYRFQLATLLSFDSSQWINKIRVPSLFVAGDEDAICFSVQVESMANKVKNSQYLLINGAGHLPHIEQPQLFSDSLIAFFVN